MGIYGKHISVHHIMITIMYFHFIVSENAIIPISEIINLKPNSNKPEQIHISIGSSLSDLHVMWATKSSEECYVEYHEFGDQVQSTKVASQKIELTHGEMAAKFVYRAKLQGLVPGSRYSYYIQCAALGTQTEKFSFAVPHNNPRKPHTFVVVADMGLITQSLPFLIHEILNAGYEVVFHVGDIAYNLEYSGGRIGDQYLNKISNFTSRVPYMTTPGDHEKAFEFYHYRHRFSMPNAPWPMTEDSLWYSIDIGYTHFISINTQLLPDAHLSNVQLKWLRNDLIIANKNRKATPWIIVMGHKPLYCTKSAMAQSCDESTSPVRDQFENIFFEQGVDLYISGHKHSYERSWPMYDGRVFQTDNINPMAPIYIISGTMGYEYLVDRQYSHPFWLAFAASEKQKELYARLTVVNESHLIWSLHAAISNEKVDNIQIIQNNHGSFGKAGPSAFEKIKLAANNFNNLPPEPFFLIDVKTDNQFRRIVLYSAVLVLTLILIAFIRFARIRKVVCVKW